MTPKQRALAIGAAWAVGTTVALIVTLPAVQPDKDFDGLKQHLAGVLLGAQAVRGVAVTVNEDSDDLRRIFEGSRIS